jgi:hypothetical protein
MDGDSFDRRRLLTGLCAVVGGSLVARSARGFPRGAANDFKAATRILDPYGVTVGGQTIDGHDVIGFDVVPIAGTGYRQSVSARNAAGGLDRQVETSVLGEDASFTHFHPGEVSPCWRGTIVGHSRAVTEIFDADQGGIQPCWRESAELLEGGHIGTLTATHFHPGETGAVQPCWRGTIEGRARAITELFDADQGGLEPCWRETAEMLEGGHIGTITATHFHPTRTGAVEPCWRTTIHGHQRATTEVLNALWGAPPDPDMPSLVLSGEMLDGGAIGAVRVVVNQLDQDLEIRVGDRVYRLEDGALVEQARSG